MTTPEPRPAFSRWPFVLVGALVFSLALGAASLFIPWAMCPLCDGEGSFPIRDVSDPLQRSVTVGCGNCGRTGRVSPLRKRELRAFEKEPRYER